jgi:hypothetical protein
VIEMEEMIDPIEDNGKMVKLMDYGVMEEKDTYILEDSGEHDFLILSYY